MKKLILLLTLIPCIAFGQKTYVPGFKFEQYLEANGMGDGIPDNDSVLTANISGVTSLDIENRGIIDLTGIEDFAALDTLECGYNSLGTLDASTNPGLTYLDCKFADLTSLDVSNNPALSVLICTNNQLTSLDVSNNTALTVLLCDENHVPSLDVSNNMALVDLWCGGNPLNSLDVSNNPALDKLDCNWNELTSLDVSNNTVLTYLGCHYNNLYCLNVKNGNNINMNINATSNSNLTCIEVDDSTWATTNWTNIGIQPTFSEDCNNGCFEPPAADFTASSTNISEGSTISFNDNSTNSPTSWSWQFSGGTPSTSTDKYTSAVYSTAGTFDVALTVTNAYGSDTITKIGYITVTSTTGIEETPTIPKDLLYITDVLGRTTLPVPNRLLFYIYDDGSVEKKIQLER